MASAFRWYNAKLASRPLLTQSLSTAVLFATGDIAAQQGVEKKGLGDHNLARTGRMALYGGCVFGPVATTWFGWLSRHVVMSNKRVEMLARVAMDQTLFAPTMIAAFLSSMATMEGVSAKKRLDKSWWSALQTNWMVWPFVQSINFTFVPLQFRVLFANLVSIGWNCYLSWVNTQ